MPPPDSSSRTPSSFIELYCSDYHNTSCQIEQGHILHVLVWVGHSCPTQLVVANCYFDLKCNDDLWPMLLRAFVGHECPTHTRPCDRLTFSRCQLLILSSAKPPIR